MNRYTRSDRCSWRLGCQARPKDSAPPDRRFPASDYGFEGGYHYACGAARNIRAYAPDATELHAIADRLQDAQRRNFYQLRASIEHTGRYSHEYSMRIALRRDSPTGQDLSLAGEEVVIEALRDLARWLYRVLDKEHDYLMSAEQVDEALHANDFTFTAAGRRFG